MPFTATPEEIQRDTLAAIERQIAELAYQAKATHFALAAHWAQASAADRRDCEQLARELVTAAHDYRRRDALALTRQHVREELLKARQVAADFDEHHSCRHLVDAATWRMFDALTRVDLSAVVVGSYRHALRTDMKSGGSR